MPTTIENPVSSRFTQEEMEKRLYEEGKRAYQEYRNFWRPLMEEQRRQQTEQMKTEPAPK